MHAMTKVNVLQSISERLQRLMYRSTRPNRTHLFSRIRLRKHIKTQRLRTPGCVWGGLMVGTVILAVGASGRGRKQSPSAEASGSSAQAP